MPFTYQTEYRLGRGRVVRHYTGVRAALAIGFDLYLSLIFGMLGFAVRLTWYCLTATARVAVELLLAPVRALRWTLRREGVLGPGPGAAKPAWAGYDEV